MHFKNFLCTFKIVLCDECNHGFHMKCLSPPLTELPDEDWYCPSCKRDPNDVIAPGAAKQTKKSNASKTNRDWGRGMACVGEFIYSFGRKSSRISLGKLHWILINLF